MPNMGKIVNSIITTIITMYLLYQGGPLTTLAKHVNIADLTIYQLLDVGICSKLASRFGEITEASFGLFETIKMMT